MVVLSSSTVARSGMMSMAAWTAVVLLAFLMTLVHASPNFKYGDVSGDEVVIDQLDDYLRTHNTHRLDALGGGRGHQQPQRYRQNIHEKIKFGVAPTDPRYNLPIPVAQQPEEPSDEELLQYLPPNLSVLGPRLPQDLPQSLQQQPQYQAELPQYQYADAPYPPQYLQDDQYPEQPDHPLEGPSFPLPEEALIYNPQLGNLLNLRDEEARAEQEDDDLEDHLEGDLPQEVLRDEVREEAKRMMAFRQLGEEKAKESGSSLSQLGSEIENINEVTHRAATSQPEAVNYLNRSPAQAQRADYLLHEADSHSQISDIYFTAIVAGCTAAAVCAVIGAGICWYRLNKSHRAAQDAEYPAYGVTGPNKDLSPSSGDRKLAQSAHMYHYQHQKQQMIALEKSSGGERHGSASDIDSEEEGEENEYTVYECPGLAPTGEMEVKNPLFHDDPTPATPSMRKEQEEEDEDEDAEEKEEKAK